MISLSRLVIGIPGLFLVLVARAQGPGFDLAQEQSLFSTRFQSLLQMAPDEARRGFFRLTEDCDSALPDIRVDMQEMRGGFRLPSLLVGNRPGWVSAPEKEPLLNRLFAEGDIRREVTRRAILSWAAFFLKGPEAAFRALERGNYYEEPTLLSIVHLVGIMRRQPGSILTEKLPKELWKKFHQGRNPCNRILALEVYDSTDQTPAELLSLYRECLGGFCYLQVRALEGIYRSRDFRPEVAALLREYLQSNPQPDDGTLPGYPNVISNPVEGAKMILREIEGSKGAPESAVPRSPYVPGPPSSTPEVSKPGGSAAIVDPPAMPPLDARESGPALPSWLILGATGLAFFGLGWLMRGRRHRQS